MSDALSSAETQFWLLLLDDILDDSTSIRWEAGVWQPRKKKSPQGVEELMIYTETVAQDKGKAEVGIHKQQKNDRKHTKSSGNAFK